MDKDIVSQLFKHPSITGIERVSSNYYKAIVNGNIGWQESYIAYLEDGLLSIEYNGRIVSRDEFYMNYRDLGFLLYSYLTSEGKRKCKFTIAKLIGSKSYFLYKLISM